MNTQPEALRLADELECGQWYAQTNQWKEDAATELRRLHELNQELVEALNVAVIVAQEMYDHWDADRDMKVGKCLLALSGKLPGYAKHIDALHAALAKARGSAMQTGETE